MTCPLALSRPYGRLKWWLLSFPIYFKILGIGAVVAALFGCAILLKTRISLTNELYTLQAQRTAALGIIFSKQLERTVITADLFAVHQKLHHMKELFPEILYLIVMDKKGHVLAHTFKYNVPSTLIIRGLDSIPLGGATQIFDSPEGIIIESAVGLLEGRAGRLRLGVSDRKVVEKLSEITRSIIYILLFCMVLGQGLALILTYLITRPIRLLSLATERLRQGEYGVSAAILSDDEIGSLTRSFNEMSLNIQEKETIRVQLIQKTVSAQEDERKRISRELHDELGQSLSALLLTIQTAEQDKNKHISNVYPEIIVKIQTLIGEVKRLALALRPSLLDDYGLSSALSRYTREISKKSGIAIDYQYSELSKGGRMPDSVEVSLFRIAQEAITNMVRHAHAREASVILMRQDTAVTLLIEDNGDGFDAAKSNSAHGEHLGIMGMKERTSLLNGEFTLESSVGNGTVIRIKIPMKG